MTNKAVKPILTEHEMMRYQRRLSSYLKDYEYKNNLQAKDVAEKIDISPQKFSYVKSSKKPSGKFINSLDYLAKLGGLTEMSIGEFVSYLEGSSDKSDDPKTEKKTFEWQKILLESYEPMNAKVRSNFIDLCKKSGRDGKKKLEALIEIVNTLQFKDLDAIESLRDTLKKIL